MNQDIKDQIREFEEKFDYDKKHYPIDYIVDTYKRKDFYIPCKHKRVAWKNGQKHLFLESIFLNLPIPFIVLADREDDKLSIIDGLQRIVTIVEFTTNTIRLSGLTKLTKLNGCCYSDLPASQQRRFLNKALRIIILEAGTSEAALQDFFYRINQKGIETG